MNKNKRPLLLLLVCLVLIIVGAAIFILVSPDDLPKGKADNTSANMTAGGDFVQGDNIAFYLRDGDVYSLFEEKSTKIVEGAQGPLFFTDGGVAYLKNGALYLSQADGSLETLIVSNIKNPVVIGSWVYYIRSGEIVKMRMSDKKTVNLGLMCRGRFYVNARQILYLADDGFLYTAKTDGTNNALAASYSMADFALCGNHIIYIGTGKMLSCFPITEPSVKIDISKADAFNYIDSKIVYYSAGEINTYPLDKAEKTKIAENVAIIGGLYAGENEIYYFNDTGNLAKMSVDGTGKKVFE